MIIFFAIFVLAMIMAASIWKDANEVQNEKPSVTLKNLKTHKKCRQAFFWLALVAFGVNCIPWGMSYKTYLDSRAFYSATKEQYASSITVYKDHATIDVASIAWTDFKYQGYQNEVASFIKDLRKVVTEYNETIVKKRIFKNNILFNWLIIAPDPDMVVIKLLGPSGIAE